MRRSIELLADHQPWLENLLAVEKALGNAGEVEKLTGAIDNRTCRRGSGETPPQSVTPDDTVAPRSAALFVHFPDAGWTACCPRYSCITR